MKVNPILNISSGKVHSRRTGFALVVALGLMGFLVFLAVGLYSLSAVSLRVSEQAASQVKARSNAKMALMIALGELQSKMGPDRRISGRAGLIVKDVRFDGVSVAEETPKSWWVGVVGSDPTKGLDAQNDISRSNPAASWLISGLDPQSDPEEQIGDFNPFDSPVVMFGEESIDMDNMTGGQPITAGLVKINEPDTSIASGFAYFIDDDGLKAALAPTDPDLINGQSPATSSDLTPGAFDLSILDGMSGLQGTPISTYSKIMSTEDLSLLSGGNQLASSKRFSYTTKSLGLLIDVKNGGLKRDLTVAFEDEATFEEVFPRGTGQYTADYLCIDPQKLDVSPELQQNGYIHWEVFKDYYNTKSHIKTDGDGMKYLDPVRYSKAGPFLETRFNGDLNRKQGSLFTAGRLGPHGIGDDEFIAYNGNSYNEMMGMPYGDYQVQPSNPRTPKNHEEFKHSPVIPILQRFQANAWLEQLDSRTLRTHAQIWSSHYNPYNIALHVAGNDGGPRVLATPFVRADSDDLGNLQFDYLHHNQQPGDNRRTQSRFRDVNFTDSKTEFHAKDPVMLLPGRSHVLAYENDVQIGDFLTRDGLLYNDKVRDLTLESVYRDLTHVEITRDPDTNEKIVTPTDIPVTSYDMRVRMFLLNAALHHGVDDNNGGPGNFELHQTFWAPFAWETVDNRPGKLFNLGEDLTDWTLNENAMARLGFNLRTTREPGSSIRPLVDANIRCLFGNTRWDSPLGVEVLAAYSEENEGVMNDMIMEMDTIDEPKGYTFWGADRGNLIPNSFSRVILFDIPRSDLTSLGQLQHAGAGRFSYEPSYIVGNSYANLRIVDGAGNIDLTKWKASIQDSYSTTDKGLGLFPIDGPFTLYDASYLVNEVLWDRYAFTTIPQVADNVTSLLSEPSPDDTHFENLSSGSAKLPNARYLPYDPEGLVFDRPTLQMTSDKDDQTGAFYHNAGHVLVDGAFNVNSTSADAWEAFLSGTHELPIGKLNAAGEIVSFDTSVGSVRFPRVRHVFGEGILKKNDLDENFWIGFRELEQSEVRSLAEQIVVEIKKRGPFLSLADFVNRKLENSALGYSGALQAALDRTVNADLDSGFVDNYDTGIADEDGNDIEQSQGAGFSGQLLQGDILQMLAPYMSVRSDVFTIRAYGEYAQPGSNGEVLARAWCEARVQRYPDPVELKNSTKNSLEDLIDPPSPYGRKFKVTSFRWLSPAEI